MSPNCEVVHETKLNSEICPTHSTDSTEFDWEKFDYVPCVSTPRQWSVVHRSILCFSTSIAQSTTKIKISQVFHVSTSFYSGPKSRPNVTAEF